MEKEEVLTIGILGVLGILFLLFLTSFEIVGVGSQAILYNRVTGKINEKTLSSGFNIKNPLSKAIEYDLKIQKTEYDDITGLTQDSQSIGMNITVNWNYDGENLQDIYRTINGNPEDTVMQKAVVGTLKSALGKFKIDEVAKNREVLREKMENELSVKLKEYFIIVNNVEVTDVDFSETYDNAIEAKLVAEQKALEAKNRKEQAKYEAEAKAIENKTIAKTITPLMLKQKWLEKWDGHLPQVMNGKDGGIMINMNK